LIRYLNIGLEAGKLVVKHQNLGLPSPAALGEAQTGITNFIASFRNSSWRKVTLGQAGQLSLVGIQIVGFFTIGEMIGRRNVIGYDIPG